MGSYSLMVRASAERELRAVPKEDLRRIRRKIEALTHDPTPPGSKRLTGETRYRLRQGDWRIVYEIDFELKVVEVVKVGHRREVCRK